MAHYAYLDSFEPIDRVLAAKASELDGGKSHLPLFWLAMFEEADLREEPLSGVRFAARQDDLFALAPPYLVSDAATAMSRLKRRTPALATLIGADQRKMLQDFSAFARRLKPSIVFRLADLAAESPAGEVATRARGMLREVLKLDNAAITLEDLAPVEAVCLGADWRDQEHATKLLSGWGWQVSAEERAQRTRERKWQKVVGDRPETDFVPYTVNHSFKADDLVSHTKLGLGIVVRAIDSSKIEVLFRDGPKTLVHGRTA